MFNSSADMAAKVNLSCGHSQRYFIWRREFFATATIDTKRMNGAPNERTDQIARLIE